MIKLTSANFARAISRAQALRPVCTLLDTDETRFTFSVPRSGGRGVTLVDIWLTGGILWSSCDCPAGVGRGSGWPLPCYHVAACALALGLLPAAAHVADVSAVVAAPAPSPVSSMVSTPSGSFIADAQWSRMGATVRSFGRRLRGVARHGRGWLVGASRA